MGVDLTDLVPAHETSLADLSGKVIAIDAFNTLYQFLSIIRQMDGTPLVDSRGEVTSHLSGIIYRVTNLVEQGIKPVFVFDGKPPVLKAETIKARAEVRESLGARGPRQSLDEAEGETDERGDAGPSW